MRECENAGIPHSPTLQLLLSPSGSTFHPDAAFRSSHPPVHMTRKDDARIAALARKNAARIQKPKAAPAPAYDDTLRIKREEEGDSKTLFKEMKRREF